MEIKGTRLGRDTGVALYGPARLIAQLEHELAAYTWNLVENYATDFVVTAHEPYVTGGLAATA